MRPATEAELAGIIEGAEGPLAITGGGTRRLGTARGARLETGGLSGISLYEPGALTLVVKAGTPLAEVEATLDAEGQRLPFEAPDLRGLLGRTGQSTIGGVVATNASGPRRVQAGACRDSLIGVRFVDGTGTVIRNGGRVMKNVTGYDLVKLVAGSRGALGVLTEVAFKLLPKPETRTSLRIDGLSDAAAVAAMASALTSPFDVTGAAHWPGRGTFLRIEGFAASVAYRRAELQRRLAGFGAVDVAVDDPWPAIRDVAPFHDAAGDVWRLSTVPSEAAALAARAGADQVLYDWGGGLVWLRLAEGTDLRARLGPFQGHATLVRSASALQRFQPEPAPIAALTKGLRAKFDPRGLFSVEI
ncbi:FAD-binding protein [Paragemmobacter straminiformis]|uniref:FAD-binding protein n=1 Tax=Paragemmobacter straminiformis TaxID=2045119 RepID=A0A842I2K9_9RHOB|nr:FAD-binding protein [Gemmobacter straminiformis]MBC2834180.1 FAD-binding protein [Gemmobacter straminiformis]